MKTSIFNIAMLNIFLIAFHVHAQEQRPQSRQMELNISAAHLNSEEAFKTILSPIPPKGVTAKLRYEKYSIFFSEEDEASYHLDFVDIYHLNQEGFADSIQNFNYFSSCNYLSNTEYLRYSDQGALNTYIIQRENLNYVSTDNLGQCEFHYEGGVREILRDTFDVEYSPEGFTTFPLGTILLYYNQVFNYELDASGKTLTRYTKLIEPDSTIKTISELTLELNEDNKVGRIEQIDYLRNINGEIYDSSHVRVELLYGTDERLSERHYLSFNPGSGHWELGQKAIVEYDDDRGTWTELFFTIDEDDEAIETRKVIYYTRLNYPLNNETKNEWEIYPNPATNKLFIQELKGDAQYRIFDLTGHLLSSGNLNGEGVSQIDIHALKPGSYLLMVGAENTINTFRFIKR